MISQQFSKYYRTIKMSELLYCFIEIFSILTFDLYLGKFLNLFYFVFFFITKQNQLYNIQNT